VSEPTTRRTRPRLWRPDSHKTVSGEAGAVHSTLGDLQLVDADGTEYGEHEDAALAGESLTLDSLNPNVPKTFSTVFEVPKDAVEGIRFRATDLAMFGPEEVMIDLGLAAE
jgi:hypothetical protein